MTPLMRSWVLPAMTVGLGAYIYVHRPVASAADASTGWWWRHAFATSGETVSAPPLIDGVALIAAALAALAAASAISRRFVGRPFERPLVFGVAAFGFLVIPAAYIGAVAGWIGAAQLRPPLGPLLITLPALAVTVREIREGWRPTGPRLRIRKPAGLALGLAALAAALLATSAGLGVLRPPTGFDALSFHAPMAVYFWRDGNIVSLLDRAPWGFALAFPGAAELWFGLLLTGLGERGANLGQLPFALLGAAAVHAFSRQLGFRHGAASVAGLAFLIAPIVVIQAGIQVNDVAAAALLMTAVSLACVADQRNTPLRFAIIGLAVGLAVTVKLAVVPGAAMVAFATMATIMGASRPRGERVRMLMAFALAFGVAVGPWAARNAVRFGNPLYPAALPFLGRGVVIGDFAKNDTLYVPTALAWPLYPLLEAHSDRSGLGPLFLIGAGPGILAASWRRRRRPLMLYSGVSVVSLVAWWVLTQHEPRHVLAVLGLAFGFVPGSLLLIPRGLRRFGVAVLLIGGISSAVITWDRALAPRVREPAERARFYDEVWGIDPLVARNAPQQMLYNTGYASLSYAGDYALLGPSLDRVLLTVDTGVSTRSVVALMQRYGAEFAYVPAAPRFQPVVEAMYSPDLFDLVHSSTVTTGKRAGTRRYLFRLRARPSDSHEAVLWPEALK